MTRTDIHHVGTLREPVLVIDRATGIVPDLIDHAATRAVFQPAASIGSFYPGLLGTLPTAYVDALVQSLLPLIARHFDTGPLRPRRVRANLGLVTTPPHLLSPEQRMPHVDAADPLQFAAVHYLHDRDHGGTGFFRHRATGLERIDADTASRYHAALATEPPPPPGYPADGPAFALTYACPPALDRLVVYRSALLHSGLIPALPDHPEDPRRGRLTANLFLLCQKATP